jgi:hypothetical protein
MSGIPYGPTPSVTAGNAFQAEVLKSYHTVKYTPAADMNAGNVAVVNGIPAIATVPIAAGVEGTLWYLTAGTVVKDASVFGQFDLVYWNPTGNPVGGVAGSGCATADEDGAILMGRAITAQVAADAAVDVLLMAAFSPDQAGGQGVSAQDTFEAVLLADKAYEFGTVRRTPHGDEFVYALAGSGGVQSEFGAVNTIASIAGAVAPTQAAGAGAIGSTSVTVTVAASGVGVSGAAGDGAVALNELIGGDVWIGNGANQHPQCRRITGNTAVVGGGACTIRFENPLTAAVVVGVTNIEVSGNPYRYTQSANVANSAYMSVVGIPAVTCAAGYCYWLRRKGRVWVTSDNNTGKVANGRDLFFQTNGSLVSASGTTYACRQRAGYALDLSASGASNAPNLMLQL